MAATDFRTIARRSIQSVAAANNLPTQLEILSERWNTIARLGDSDVVAKAATLAILSRLDPVHWFKQEVAVSTQLVALGAPVQMPAVGLHTFHVVNNLPITLWQHIDGKLAGSCETEMVDSLAELHRLGDGIELNQPWFATITVEIQGTLEMLADRIALKPKETRALTDHLNRLLAVVDGANLSEGFVHGDAQRKNSMHTADGTIWIDLEETCRSPYAWDLACLTMNPMFDSERVLDRYAEVSGTNRVSVAHLDTLKHLRDIEGLVWMLAIQDEREPTFRDETQVQLTRVLEIASVG